MVECWKRREGRQEWGSVPRAGEWGVVVGKAEGNGRGWGVGPQGVGQRGEGGRGRVDACGGMGAGEVLVSGARARKAKIVSLLGGPNFNVRGIVGVNQGPIGVEKGGTTRFFHV